MDVASVHFPLQPLALLLAVPVGGGRKWGATRKSESYIKCVWYFSSLRLTLEQKYSHIDSVKDSTDKPGIWRGKLDSKILYCVPSLKTSSTSYQCHANQQLVNHAGIDIWLSCRPLLPTKSKDFSDRSGPQSCTSYSYSAMWRKWKEIYFFLVLALH